MMIKLIYNIETPPSCFTAHGRPYSYEYEYGYTTWLPVTLGYLRVPAHFKETIF